MQKTALVTGDMGFVGRHMVRRLIRDGWQVRTSDIKRGWHDDCRRRFQHDDTKYDLVVHLAAIIGGRAMIDGQPLKVATDLAIDADFFQFVSRTKPRKVVYFSSSAAYPISLQYANSGIRLSEGHIDLTNVEQPDAIYGWVKLTGEMGAGHVAAEGVDIHVFRPFSGYGGDQDLDYPFPSLIQRAMQRESPFKVWGASDQVRDWVHINDVIECVIRSLEYRGPDIGPVNIASGRGTSFKTLAGMMMREAGYEAPVEVVPGPLGVMYRVGDPRRMHQFFHPTITLEEGIHLAMKGSRR